MIPISEPWIDHEEIDLVMDCLKSGWISSQGKYIEEFETAFSGFCGTRFGVATSNGTTALHLALLTLGIGPGDEVIVPALSFIASANVVLYTGAKPVFADVDERTWTLDPSKLRPLITNRTKAIIPVHLYGHPADMGPIMKLAEENQLWVIEDAAEAHGAEYKGEKVGSLGHMGCFSFYGNKIISTGEGGMIVTNNPEWVEKARILRDHGMSKKIKYWHPVVGYNFRMTNIQAAIGLGQMTKLGRLIEKKREIADRYTQGLKKNRGLILSAEETWAKSVYWLYSIILKPEIEKNRDDLITFLAQAQVESRPVFYPIPDLPPYHGFGTFPAASRISKGGISLPSGFNLTSSEQNQVIELIQSYLDR
ncbi:MAG: DegT/DnrJ/EryC1/StrS family aminotransferase [Deltaproteobacteria bacterium]|nr:DegT/DnrJ/EryC1/StrS family aminotransferase [Deltaproteobacteria bacterium]